jgi:hypothetical protein
MSRKHKFLDEDHIRDIIEEDDDNLEIEVEEQEEEEEEEEDVLQFQTEEVQEVEVYVGTEEVTQTSIFCKVPTRIPVTSTHYFPLFFKNYLHNYPSYLN